jgi:arylsulfatase A-like enzyme
MAMRHSISVRDCIVTNLKAGVLTGALAGVVQFLVFKLAGVYLMESLAVHVRSLLQIAGMTGLLFAAVGILLGLAGGLIFSRIRSLWGRALAGPQPAPMWTFGLLAIPAMWFLAWFNFSFRRARDPWCVAINIFFLLVLLAGAVLIQHSRYRSASAKPRSRTRRPSAIGPIALLLAAGLVFLVMRSSAFGLLIHSAEPQPLRGPLPEVLHDRARAALPDSAFNVILLTVDALRPDHLGCYGYPRNTSPAIDSLAASGVRFNNAVVQYPMTSPNFATMFTGTYPTTHGVIRVRTVLGDDNLTLAEVLQASGYHTAAAITNGNLYPVFNYSQGFDEYHRCGHKEPERVTRTSLEWLASGPQEPFFLWMHYTEPHGPYDPRPPYDTMFDPADNPKTSTMSSEAEEERVARAIARYDGSIRRTDHAIRRLLTGIREMGYGDNTLLVFTTDHGESFGEHGYYFGHGAYAYEATVRAALFLAFPEVIPAGLAVDAPVGTVDIMPTLLDAVGLPLGERIEGHSFLPTALGLTDQTPGEFAFVQAGVVKHGALGFVSAVRSEQYKYIRRHREWGLFPADPASWFLSLTSVFEGGLSEDELYAIQDAREVDNLIRKDPAMARLLRTKVDGFLAYLDQVEDRPEAELIDPSDLDAETYEALKSLGYIR